MHPNFSSPLSTDSCTPLFHPTGSPSLSPHFPTSLLPHSHTPLSCLFLEPHFLALLGHPLSHLTPLSNHFFFTSLLHPSLSLYSCTFLTPLLHPIAHLIFSPLSHLNPLSQPTFLLHSCNLISHKLSHPFSLLTLAPHSFTPLSQPSLTSLLPHFLTLLSHPTFSPHSHLTIAPHFLTPSLISLSHPTLLPDFFYFTSAFPLSPYSRTPSSCSTFSPHCPTPLSHHLYHLTVALHSLTPLSHPNLHISLTP